MGLLIVERKVFQEGIHTLLCRALNGFVTEYAGEVGILGIILEISARERRSVNIYGGAVPAFNFAVQTVFAYALSHFEGEFFIPGAGDEVLARPRHSLDFVAVFVLADDDGTVIDDAVEPRGAVEVGNFGLCDRIHGGSAISAFVYHFCKFFKIHLIEQIFPQRVVIIEPAEIYEIDAVVCAERVSFGNRTLGGIAR